MWEILELCKKHGVLFGATVSDSEPAAKWLAAGCLFFGVVELELIDAGVRQVGGGNLPQAWRRVMPNGVWHG